LPGDESRIEPGERRQPPHHRVHRQHIACEDAPRGEGSSTPASLPFGAACLPEVEETRTVEDN
jgi:hypothetical protein